MALISDEEIVKRTAEDEAVALVFEGAETFPAINVAETVDKLIDERGIQEAAAHAADIARIARVMKEPEVAADWDEVYRLILARRAL